MFQRMFGLHPTSNHQESDTRVFNQYTSQYAKKNVHKACIASALEWDTLAQTNLAEQFKKAQEDELAFKTYLTEERTTPSIMHWEGLCIRLGHFIRGRKPIAPPSELNDGLLSGMRGNDGRYGPPENLILYCELHRLNKTIPLEHDWQVPRLEKALSNQAREDKTNVIKKPKPFRGLNNSGNESLYSSALVDYLVQLNADDASKANLETAKKTGAPAAKMIAASLTVIGISASILYKYSSR